MMSSYSLSLPFLAVKCNSPPVQFSTWAITRTYPGEGAGLFV